MCTGEPRPSEAKAFRRAVYPRVYGGTHSLVLLTLGSLGLSPCVRGNPLLNWLLAVYVRSIPVCTGEPVALLHAGQVDPVYPRVYGGTLGTEAIWAFPAGLSPCVRGNPRV